MKESVKIAIITAVLTGAFTVAASLATYWITNKSPEIVYTLVGGPSFSSPEGAKRIFVLEINNTGAKEIKNAFVQISLPTGELSEVAADATAGVKISEKRSKSLFELNTDILNPEDTVKISLLTTQQNNGPVPSVVVRAPGINATDITNKTKTSSFEYIFAAVTAIAVLAQLLSTFVTSRYKNKHTKSGTSISPREQSTFIFGACGLKDETPYIGPSYRSAADLLRVLSTDSEKAHSQALVALKAHLLIGRIESSSLRVIKHHIQQVSGDLFTEEEFKKIRDVAADEKDDPVEWRIRIRHFIKEELNSSSLQLSDEAFLELKKILK
ncbi:hypothetical protein [Pseudomonas mosselii]|uniref:hypothetical protein n=1 Tax=Pseudomonas mosselii TaxID=78327 RepID=UPI001F3F6716|nr:hypothetical protein [Pseudomonas mosselii]